MMDYKQFADKTILITGATGLIGSTIVKTLLGCDNTAWAPARVIAAVRNKGKAEKMFSCLLGERLQFIVCDVCMLEPQNMDVDYIIHGASQTASKSFVAEPVETVMTAIKGTRNLLEFARVNPVRGFVYLSSMEVYGSPISDEKITEDHATNLDVMKVRSCYPESKRMCENLCTSYAAEYGVPTKVVRLTQTFGPGVQYNDGRVFAEFARCAIEGRNIVLKTRGETKRSYLYTKDAVDAILTVLIHGKVGEAYNAANEDTYCSIYEMACLVAERCAEGRIRIIIDETGDPAKMGYAPTLHMNLDTSKLHTLGWKAKMDLYGMYKNMISDMQINFSCKMGT